MNLYVRFCIECGRGYDLDISKDKCPECREKKREVKDDGKEE